MEWNRDLDIYMHNISSAEDPLLAELDRVTNLNVVQPRMISGHIQGKFLEILTRILKPRRVLEIGTFTGYATLCMAAGLPENGIIDTYEVDDELAHISSEFFERSPHGAKIRSHTGSIFDVVLPEKRYDMVFIDGDKREYPEYYRLLMGDTLSCAVSVVGTGSVILADNILWYGKVASKEVPANDKHTLALIEFNRMVADDSRVESVVLPIRDGINFIRVL